MTNKVKDEDVKELVAYGLEMQEVGFDFCICIIESIAEKMRNEDYIPLFNINVLIETLKENKKEIFKYEKN